MNLLSISLAYPCVGDYLGWLPYNSFRVLCRGTLDVTAAARIHGLLRRFPLPTPPSTELGFFAQASALWRTVVAPIRSCQNVVNGAWSPPETQMGREPERLVLVRFFDQTPWQTGPGGRVLRRDLERFFPTRGFEPAMELLRNHGRAFVRHHEIEWRRVGSGHVIMIQTAILNSVLLGFEVSLQVRVCTMIALPRPAREALPGGP